MGVGQAGSAVPGVKGSIGFHRSKVVGERPRVAIGLPQIGLRHRVHDVAHSGDLSTDRRVSMKGIAVALASITR